MCSPGLSSGLATKLTLYVAGLVLVSELDHGFSSGGLEGDSSPVLYTFLLSAAGTIAIGVVCHFRWKRKVAIESQLFEKERNRIARRLGRAPSSLQFYDPDFYVRNTSQPAAQARDRVPGTTSA